MLHFPRYSFLVLLENLNQEQDTRAEKCSLIWNELKWIITDQSINIKKYSKLTACCIFLLFLFYSFILHPWKLHLLLFLFVYFITELEVSV